MLQDQIKLLSLVLKARPSSPAHSCHYVSHSSGQGHALTTSPPHRRNTAPFPSLFVPISHPTLSTLIFNYPSLPIDVEIILKCPFQTPLAMSSQLP